jgi:hypothetical protein
MDRERISQLRDDAARGSALASEWLVGLLAKACIGFRTTVA